MLTQLQRLLPQLLRNLSDSDQARQQAVFAAWAVAVGSPTRRVTAPVKFERKTLFVAVPDATWRAQMRGISGRVIFKMNSLLGAPTVTAIEFVIRPEQIADRREAPHKITFTAPEARALPLRDKAAEIANPELRAAFLRAAGKCLERRAQ